MKCLQEVPPGENNNESAEANDHEHHLGEPSQSYVVEPETESEGSVTYSEHQAGEGSQHEDQSAGRSLSKAASFTSVDQDVADLQTGMQNVRIEEPVEDAADDAADDAKSSFSRASAQNHHNVQQSDAETHGHNVTAADTDSSEAAL